MPPHGDDAQVPGPKYVLGKAEKFQSAYATGAYGGIDSSDAHIIFYADRIDPEIDENTGEMRVGKIARDLIVDIRMTPAEFIALAAWMNRHVEQFKERTDGSETGPS
ncbi:MAG: hypothetical protein M0P22_00690 [Methanoculleus sp.]|jgi:hypothetical protein|nr:hypothetical protein [Methanoculleus sp.]